MSYIQFEKRLSKHTILAYSTDLAQFSVFYYGFHGLSTIENAQFSDLRSWIVSLSDQKLEHKSINRKMATLRAFYRYLLIKGKISDDPTKLLKSLKVPKNLPVYLEEKSTKSLFEKVDFGNDFSDRRDKLILELLYGTGIRLSELINIKTLDIDFTGKKIKVLGKRNKYRIMPLSTSILNTISSYLEQRQDLHTHQELLLTDKGMPLYPMFVQRLTSKYLEIVSTISKKSPHVLRHTFATHLLNNGAELTAIKELLGHSSLAATQIYTHNSINKLKEIHKKSHPKA